MKPRTSTLIRTALGASVLLLAASPGAAQKMTGSPAAAGYRQEPGQPSSTLPAALREIGFDQHLNERVPLDVTFTDETGRTVPLGDYFGRRPVVMLFAYYQCPMLCTQVINGLASALNVLSLEPGTDFDIVTVSFDSRDTPATASAKKAHAIERYTRQAAAESWHFLTGSQASIDRLTNAAGFRYVWDTPTNKFAQPSGVNVKTPDGLQAL
jgi:protein SCO1/2